ncbi:MAG: zinc-ribbon domain-containing protein [Chloroflexia bacterium]|nr:zinc-ribbon domain-containing protein [Chloroflexia bacterium]
MFARHGYCPQCGHPHGSDDRFCPNCGASRDEPDRRLNPEDDDSRRGWPTPSIEDQAPSVVLLTFGPGPEISWATVMRLTAAALLTVSLFVGWGLAEHRIVDRDTWPLWNVVWIACGVGSAIAVTGWLVYWRHVRHRARRHRG